MALRDIPFEAAGGYGGSGYPTGGQVGGVGGLLYGNYDGQDRRGQDFVKLDHEERWDGRRSRRGGGQSRSGNAGGRGGGSGGGKQITPVFLPDLLLRKFVVGMERLGIDVAWLRELAPSMLSGSSNAAPPTPPPAAAEDASRRRDESFPTAFGVDGGTSPSEQSTISSTSSRKGKAERALHHLVKASELGNPLAQTMVAQTLANGILPVAVPSGLRSRVAGNLTVPSDFAHGGSQLSRALVLWHSAAMGGSVEAALALGYRSKYSAGMGNHHEDKFILDATLRRAATADKIAEYKRAGMSEEEAASKAHREEADTNPQAERKAKIMVTPDGHKIITHENMSTEDDDADPRRSKSLKDETTPSTLHPSAATSHYGLLGTCESALAYYETAAHLAMDEMEASELRGKVNPASDSHRLPIIHAHGGASSALSHANKPDELEEAIQYYRLRAYAKPDPDVNAAYTLAQLYHHGLRGVKQSLSLALEYYTIAAEAGSWEAAGQVGKFHLWGMGVNETQRDLSLAYRYFKMGTPGGVEGCLRRYRGRKNASQAAARRKKKKELKKKQKKSAAAASAEEKEENGHGGVEGEGGDQNLKEDNTWVDESREEEIWSDADQCDHPCVNGMGLLYLFGVPMVLPPSREVATKYFELAKELGNMDASYNLAMLRLGWMDEIGAKQSIPHQKDISTINNAKKGKFVVSSNARDSRGLTVEDYKYALNNFNAAAVRGHIQAKHRLGMLFSKGVKVIDHDLAELAGPDKIYMATATVIPKNCASALEYYKFVSENGLAMTRRIRAAYKQYVAGDYSSSLRNYLAAAESGNVVAQINAAFLLERGTCLGLSPADCTNAAVRMWRAAARQGDVEACLRVGDFYYYGRLLGAESDDDGRRRKSNVKWDGTSAADGPIGDGDTAGKSPSSRLPGSEYKVGYSIGPYPWIRYILYPEDLIFLLRKKAVAGIKWVLNKKFRKRSTGIQSASTAEGSEQSCLSGPQEVDGTCGAPRSTASHSDDSNHLSLAARYYRMAAEEHESARANFNLGFMHEWGLGLKQDFPLAKRHYDLAASTRSGEAELAVQFALIAMDWHERIVRWKIVLEDWKESEGGLSYGDNSLGVVKSVALSAADAMRTRLFGAGKRRNNAKIISFSSSTRKPKSPEDVLIQNLLSWETFTIFLLALAIARLITDRVERQQRAQMRQ